MQRQVRNTCMYRKNALFQIANWKQHTAGKIS